MSPTEPKRQLRVLVVEDSDADVTLLGRELRRGGFGASLERVETEEEMAAALGGGGFDLVVSDWKMPRFSALAAVAVARRLAPDVPVIIVSGTVGEETAVEALKAGAADFVTKDHPARLLPAVERELREAVNRRARLDAERRLEAERREREAEDRYRRWLESIPALAFRCTAEGEITECNRRWLEYTGMSEAAVRGSGWLDAVHPDDRARVARTLADHLTAGERFECEFRVHRSADGAWRWHLGRALPEKGAEPAAFWTGTATDIEDQKRAEEELRASDERFRRLLHVLPVPLYACDVERRVTVFNEQAAALWGGRPAAGDRWCESCRLFAPDGAPVEHAACPTAEALCGRGGSPGVEVVLERLDGERRTVVSHAEAIRDASGRIVAAVNVLVDISGMRDAERALRASEQRHRQLADALQEADRRKDEFLGMLSHELRNPLAPIRNSLYVLEHADPAGQQALRARAVAARQVRYLSRLVDDLLDVTRIASGKIRLRRGRVDLAALAVRTAEDYRALMAERHLELVVDVAGVPVPVEGDETRLAQILGNLLQNAAKFTPAGGRVTLSAFAEGGKAVMAVGDTGCGIAPELLDFIFEPFTQAKQTLARSEGGLGLGLALVKGLVALHGGEVAAESAGAGRGATFTVALPLAEAAAVAVVAAAAERAPPRPGGARRRRVLVVDDNRDAADSLAQILQLLGHEASVAYDGASALALARERAPDVVLCDLGLPLMDGFEVARHLRADGRSMRLVAVTGYAQPDDVRAAAEAGFDDHLAKPADLEAIRRVLT